MTPDASLPPPGWYSDPYWPASVRWFDGSMWTIHAVPAGEHESQSKTERTVEAMERRASAEDTSKRDRFQASDLAVPLGRERPYDGGGGWQGLYVNRIGRMTMRAGTRWGPVRSTRWMVVITALLALLAWGDSRVTG